MTQGSRDFLRISSALENLSDVGKQQQIASFLPNLRRRISRYITGNILLFFKMRLFRSTLEALEVSNSYL